AFASAFLERKKSVRTLACFLQGMQGKQMSVELRDFTLIQGRLLSCDCYMNLEMLDATIYWRKKRSTGGNSGPVHCERFFISCKFIRFVHFDSYVDTISVLQRSIKKTAKVGPKRFETSSKSYQMLLNKKGSSDD
uniref:Sm domain-containing protein n=1 Tax=Parascaris univalens TaxID=6257 RepID=A0A915AB36_PARUN